MIHKCKQELINEFKRMVSLNAMLLNQEYSIADQLVSLGHICSTIKYVHPFKHTLLKSTNTGSPKTPALFLHMHL